MKLNIVANKIRSDIVCSALKIIHNKINTQITDKIWTNLQYKWKPQYKFRSLINLNYQIVSQIKNEIKHS